jgi:ATP-dependent Clp protease ATP-binding subunit ClpA
MSSSFENTVKRAYAIASERRHELVTLEHLLMALLEAAEIRDLVKEVGGDLAKLSKDTLAYIDDVSNHVIVKNGAYQPRHTTLLLTVVKKAKTQSLFSGKADLGSLDLFMAMFNIDNSFASYFLQSAGLDRDAILQLLKKEQKKEMDAMAEETAMELLAQFCVNLNEKAAAGKIDPLIGRETEVESITQIMARRTKHNVIMLGDPGVGKTIIVEGLAKRIVEGDVPDVLADKTIWSLDIGSMVAGTKFRGDFEERVKQVIAAFTALPNAIMFIDEIHMIMGAGGGSQGAMDAANLLKPALSRGEIRCIGSTTIEEYRKHFEKDRALGRRFQRLDINEPSIEDSKRILTSLAPYYSKYHGVAYDQAALDAAVDLSVRYIHGRFLPDKAIDVIDSAGARQRIKPLHERAETININEIKEEISHIAKVPVSTETESEQDRLQDLEQELKNVVFGQDEAINRLVDAVLISRSGLREGNKTQGAFLFSGPTGVGKTEVAKQLAQALGVEFVRFDMSEFQERHTVSKFIGSPPGYVGYGDGTAGSGMLINALERHPHCVILCDEVEKAHPDIVSIFLQVMDNGMISSQSGKDASARHAFLIFTSNLGAEIMEKPVIGFGNQERKDEDKEAIKRWFSPEFRNRLDGMIMFNRLSMDNMSRVLDKFIAQLNNLTEQKKVSVVFNADAKKWLMAKGFDRNMGARPLARIITDSVKTPLSKEILFGRLKHGGGVMFTVRDDKLVFDVIDASVTNIGADIDANMEGVE